MKRKLLSATTSVILALSFPTIAQAQTTKNLTVENIQQSGAVIPIQVHSGFGFNISFFQTDEVITYINLDNPARYSLSSDQPLCSSGNNCQSGESQLLHLRLMKGIELPNLSIAKNGQTYLTVKTVERNSNKQNLYVFLLSPGKGRPKYHTLNFVSAVPVQPASVIQQPVLPPNTLDLLAVSEGLAFAQSQNKLPENPELWRRIHSFIALVKDGKPYLMAMEEAGVSLSLVKQLEAWGRGSKEGTEKTQTTQTTPKTGGET